jgi:hypothetical protein
MIVVSVKLDSAISPARDKELARVYISNVGVYEGGKLGDYHARSLRGRGKAALDLGTVNRQGLVLRHPREREHVLNLVAKALNEMGYGK